MTEANLRVSIDKIENEDDESVEYLLEKLKKKGKKVKVLGEDDDDEELERDNLV